MLLNGDRAIVRFTVTGKHGAFLVPYKQSFALGAFLIREKSYVVSPLSPLPHPTPLCVCVCACVVCQLFHLHDPPSERLILLK